MTSFNLHHLLKDFPSNTTCGFQGLPHVDLGEIHSSPQQTSGVASAGAEAAEAQESG